MVKMNKKIGISTSQQQALQQQVEACYQVESGQKTGEKIQSNIVMVTAVLMYACICICVCICLRVSVYMCIYVRIYIYIYILRYFI